MDIRFRTHSELTEIETLLMSRGYRAMNNANYVYYTDFTNEGLIRVMGSSEFLFVNIEMETKNYKVTFNSIGRNPLYIYPEMKNGIYNMLSPPSYKPRKILKS